MPDPEVIQVMRQFKASLLAGEQSQMQEMARRWLAVERRLQGQMDALALEMTQIKQDGGTVSVETLLNQTRYRELMTQLSSELETYSGYVERSITDRQGQLVRLGVKHAEQAITSQGLTGAFNRLPIEAVEHLAGFASNGSPLNRLLMLSWPDAAAGLTQELITGVALGYNPRKTAKMMAQGATGSLDRMMTIARTEQLRAYRSANLESYRASGVVTQYKRLATHDSRVCAGCLMAEGTVSELSEVMATHPNCRCTMVPIVRGLPSPQWKQGQEWFEEQDQATQMGILGKGKYYAWQNGDFDLSELVTVKPNATWGDTLQTTTLEKLTGPKVIMPVAQPRAREISLPYQPSTAHLNTVARNIDREVLQPLANQYGASIEEMESRLLTEMNRYVDGQVPRIRTGEDAAISILRDGRYKTEFEVDAAGRFVKAARSAAEDVGLGVPSSINATLRPIYGYYDTPQHGARAYGNVEFVLKPSVVPRTTVTLGDSLYPMQGDLMAGVPANAPTKHALGNLYSANSLLRNDMAETYIEAQMHGGLAIDDVAEVILHPNSFNANDLSRVEKAYKARGIKVTYGSIDDD
jgi:SPP1 gp7 family putative phage head morphogenesis protein